MKTAGILVALTWMATCFASVSPGSRQEAEYYVAAYSQHYGLPLEFVRAVIEQESGWQRCAVSQKGATGLMQLMPDTAKNLGVLNRCDPDQNISGGVRLLAWLARKFRGDLRLAAAAYYAGAKAIEKRGLDYANPDVIAYVASIRARVELQRRLRNSSLHPIPGGAR